MAYFLLMRILVGGVEYKMENALKWVSPKSTIGSLLIAIAAHGALYGSVLLFLAIGFHAHHEVIQKTEEIAYETFSEPPAAAKAPRPIVRAPKLETPVVNRNVKQDLAPKEMQDEKSTIAGTQAAAKPQAAPTGADGAAGDAAFTPFYKIKPKYPRAALVSGTEGWVVLKIDITESGEVENVRVIDGKERGMFQDEARRAVSKWKYKPFTDSSGKPVRKADHEVRIDFKLQDAA